VISIFPSMLCADFARLADAARELVAGGADGLHFDIMDNHFVPNLTFGPMLMSPLRGLTDLPFEAHLMVEQPESLIEESVERGANVVGVHPESTPHFHRALQMIRRAGARAMAVLNPATPIQWLDSVLEEVDQILLMSVNPGFAGQPFIPSSLDKAARLRAFLDARGAEIPIAMDGGLDDDTVGPAAAAGVRIIIAGNSVFGGDRSPADAIAALRAAAEAAINA
jgi:ribulose-phosphate 3-epimerase